jgi:hypothetical protein
MHFAWMHGLVIEIQAQRGAYGGLEQLSNIELVDFVAYPTFALPEPTEVTTSAELSNHVAEIVVLKNLEVVSLSYDNYGNLDITFLMGNEELEVRWDSRTGDPVGLPTELVAGDTFNLTAAVYFRNSAPALRMDSASDVELVANEPQPSTGLTVTEVWDAGFSTNYADYTDVTLTGLVVGFHDKGYVLQDPATAEMIAIHDSTNTPVLGDRVELVGQFNVSYDVARIVNVSSLSVLEQGLSPNWDTSNAVELAWTDLANFDIALYQGKLVKVTGLWAKLYSGGTSYARIAHDEAGTGSKQYDGAYIGLQNGANELNLTGTLADIFTGGDTATEYAGLTLYLFFYDSSSSYEKAVILTDAFVVQPEN